jgi:hypothetical protein
MMALPDSLFINLIEATALDKQIKEQQNKDKELLKEWEKRYQLARDAQGIRWKNTALVVTGEMDMKRTILHSYHDGVTAGHPGTWKTYACHGSKGTWLEVSVNVTCSAQVLSVFHKTRRGFTRREE